MSIKGVAVEGLPEVKGGRVRPVALCVEGRTPLAHTFGLDAVEMIKELCEGSETGGDLVTVKVDWLVAMLALGANDATAAALWKGERCHVGPYVINYVPALCLWIRDGERSVRVNDIQRWIPPDQMEANNIFRGSEQYPEQRSRWEWSQDQYGDAVRGAECGAAWIGDIAREIDGALSRAGLPRYWRDGTGRVAGAILDRIASKDDIEHPPYVLDSRIATAYVGGRISVFQTGHYDRITQVDLNSAYPWAMTQLPSLAGAVWVRRKHYDSSAPWAVWRVSWDVPNGAVSGPFPVRTANGAIAYPLAGSGWYWAQEVRAAVACYGRDVTPADGFQIVPSDDTFRPFAKLSDLYSVRKQMKVDGDTAASHVAKIALTSCYGRLAQSVQWNGKPGRWGCLALAGIITATVRATMMTTLWEHETTAIAIATDSLTVSGDIGRSSTGDLGGWKVQHGDDAIMFPSGVFRVASGDAAMERVSGVERARAMQIDWPLMTQGWDTLGLAMSYKVALPMFHGLGMAGSTNTWGKFGQWRIFRHEIVGKPDHAKPVRIAPRTWRLMPQPGKPMHARRYQPRGGIIGRTDDQLQATITDVAREHDQPIA